MTVVRLVLLLVTLAGCRQLFQFDDPVVATEDASVVDAAPDVFVGPRKRVITIDPMRVAGRVTDFPFWFVLQDPELASQAFPDGTDLRFTAPNGSPLPYQIQLWDPLQGRIEAWVRIDVEVDAPTELELHYGAPSTQAPDPPLVFNSGFAAVWHLDDALAPPAIEDATGASTGTVALNTTPVRVPGRLGSAVSFDGVDDQITFTNPLVGNMPHTISVWVDARTATDFDSILTVGNPAQNQSRWFHARFLTNNVAVGLFANDWADTGTTVVNAGWTLLHWVYEGSGRVSRMYRDAVLVGMFQHAGGVNTQGTAGYLGFAPMPWGSMSTTFCALNGSIDEARIATVARSAEYIATEFANQSSPETFYTVGPAIAP